MRSDLKLFHGNFLMKEYLRTICSVFGNTFVHVSITNLSANTNERTHCQKFNAWRNCGMRKVALYNEFDSLRSGSLHYHNNTKYWVESAEAGELFSSHSTSADLRLFTWCTVLIHTFHFFAFPLLFIDLL